MENKHTSLSDEYKYYWDILKNIGFEASQSEYTGENLNTERKFIDKSLDAIDKIKENDSSDLEGLYVIKKEIKNFSLPEKEDLLIKSDFNFEEFIKDFKDLINSSKE